MNFFDRFTPENKNKSINNIMENFISEEARNVLRDQQLKINTKTESLFENSVAENLVIFSLAVDSQQSLDIFNRLKKGTGGVTVTKLHNYYIPRVLKAKLPAKNVVETYNRKDIQLDAKKYGIPSVIYDQSLITNMSTMYDLSKELTTLKTATVGRQNNAMNTRTRQAVLNLIKDRIVSFPEDNKRIKFTNKIVIIPAPFFEGTKIKLNLIEKDLMNVFSPFLLIWEWLYSDLEGFTKFMKDNNVAFMFANYSLNSYMFLTKNDKIIKNKAFNPRTITKLLHRLDGSKDPELTEMSSEEQELVESTQPVTNENLPQEDKKILDNHPEEEKLESVMVDDISNPKGIVNTHGEMFGGVDSTADLDVSENTTYEDEEIRETMLEKDASDIEINKSDIIPVEEIIRRNEKEHFTTLTEVIQDQDMSEVEKVEKINEIHNYSNLKLSVETPSIKNLRSKMASKFGRDAEDVVKDIKRHKIETTNFKNVYDGSGFNKSQFTNMEKTYNEEVGKSDFEGSLISGANSSISPMFLKDYKETPINTREFYGKQLDLTYQDINGNEHKITLDYPLSYNGKLFLGGSFKQLNLQDASKPVVKTDEDVVVTSPYNKTFLSLKGYYGSKSNKKLVFTIDEYVSNGGMGFVSKTSKELGNFIYNNMVSYELIHLNRFYNKVITETTDIDFRGKVKDGYLTILGHIGDKCKVLHDPSNNSYVLTHAYNPKTKKYEEVKCDSLENFIIRMTYEMIQTIGDKEKREHSLKLYLKLFGKIQRRTVTPTKINGVYAKVMARDIPLVYLLLSACSLDDLLKRLKEENELEYKFYKGLNDDVKRKASRVSDVDVLEFGDGTVLMVKYNNTLNEIILSPLMNSDMSGTEVFNITNIINDLMGSSTTLIYIENFVDFFVSDPTMQRVLRMYNMPTDFVGLFIYAASLFTSYKTHYKSDSSNYRVIGTSEVINRCLYDVLSKEFSNNAARVKMGSRTRLSIPRDALIRKLQELPNMSEYTTLNPFRSIACDSKKSAKGHLGTNQSRAYGTTLRMMHENNIGTETMATPYSAEAGVTKTLPVNPIINGLTGEYETIENIESFYEDPSKVASFVDSYVPYLNCDHPIRGVMANNQFGHNMPCEDGDPMVVSTGADEAAVYLAKDFSMIAEEDGEVLSSDGNFTKVKYKSGKIDAIAMDLDYRNADKGFFVPNKMKLADELSPGKKFKKGDIICYNKNFYKKKPNGRIGLSAGPLATVCIVDSEGTWEDACLPFESLAKRMSSKVTKRVARVMDLNTEIRDWNTDINSVVDAEDVLYKFRVLDEDDVVSQYLSVDENLAMNEVTAHNHGIIKDIRVYWRNKRDMNMSETMKSFIKEVKLKQRKICGSDTILDVTDQFKKSLLNREPQDLSGNGSISKINGDIIENGQVLIEYFIEFEFGLGTADKIVVDRALKGEISNIYPNELRAVGALSGRKADVLFNTYGILARITPGMILHGNLIAISEHVAIKNRMILNLRPEKDSYLDYTSSYDMLEGKYGYKD